MQSLLISMITVLLGSTLFSGFATAASIVVLVANGSDITINLPAEYSQNRLLNVVSDSGNNNPSVFDWIGGNGANKAPRLSIGGGNQGSNGGGKSGVAAAVIDALWKMESSTASGSDRDEEFDDSGETVAVSRTTEGGSVLSSSTLPLKTAATRTTLNTWYGKYVTEAMAQSGWKLNSP